MTTLGILPPGKGDEYTLKIAYTGGEGNFDRKYLFNL
jgi:hypothetical protein